MDRIWLEVGFDVAVYIFRLGLRHIAKEYGNVKFIPRGVFLCSYHYSFTGYFFGYRGIVFKFQGKDQEHAYLSHWFYVFIYLTVDAGWA